MCWPTVGLDLKRGPSVTACGTSERELDSVGERAAVRVTRQRCHGRLFNDEDVQSGDERRSSGDSELLRDRNDFLGSAESSPFSLAPGWRVSAGA